MKAFKVISPKGFNFSGKIIAKGDVFSADGKSAHITTGLHFKQIEEVEVKPEKPEKSEKPEKPEKSEVPVK